MSATDTWVARASASAVGLTDAVAAPRLSILIFHRVLPKADALFPEEMHAERFDRLMAMVRRAYSVVTVGQAVALHATGQLPRRALAITFDDGYADNAEVALPILQKHGLPATFFVATGFLDGGQMWNDTVIEAVRATPLLGADLGEFGVGGVHLGTAADRRQTIDALLMKIKYLSLAERERCLSQLLGLLAVNALPGNQMMRSEQVVQLHRAGMEIGGHTVNHPILHLLPDAEAEAEIVQGRHRLQDLIGAPVDVFAYPNGKPGRDYDGRHVAMVRRLGFKAAVSTSPGVARPTMHCHELPRFTPWDHSPQKWMGRLLHQRLFGPHPVFAEA